MYILGLATMGESAAAMIKDGVLVAAIEEERLTRVKHEGRFPVQSIKFCLDYCGIRLQDVDHVGIFWQPWRVWTRAKGIFSSLRQEPEIFAEKIKRTVGEFFPNGDANGSHSEGSWFDLFKIRRLLKKSAGPYSGKIHFLDHHDCHMASAFYVSPFQEATILTFDGAGEEASTTLAVGNDRRMRVLKRIFWPHSLGHFYASLTGFLGFKMLDGEYKMMGLAPYNSPDYLKILRSDFLISDGSGSFKLNSRFLDYHAALAGRFNGQAAAQLGPPRTGEEEPFTERHEKIAASAQAAFEEAGMDLALWAYKAGGNKKNLSIAGGCALNCTFNGKLLREGPFENIYVPPAPHDAGGAVGAALLVYHRILDRPRKYVMEHASYGPSFDHDEISRVLSSFGLDLTSLEDEQMLLEKTVDVLTEGKIVAWFQGRMEFGPRALGNRSFLADPRRDSIRDTINAKIKKRELFRPFAPSVKEEKASEFFEIDQPSPFMNIAVRVKPSQKNKIPAVTHIDGTARVQTVSLKHNPRYWKLLDLFEKKTGIPVLLNTSFNIQEPIVTNPDEAVRTFLKSEVDVLVIENYFITRQMLAPRSVGEAVQAAGIAKN